MGSKKLDFSGIWVEAYRPTKLDDLILDEASLRVVSQFKDEIPNLLFTGSPGVGKTTLARIIVNDILGCNFLYINASDESGIDTIRHNITNFAQTKSFDGGIKVVVLDECLHEDTLVTVLDQDGDVRQIPIRNLDHNNQLVKTYNKENDLIEWRPFNLGCSGEKEVYEVEFENGQKITCTDTHKWYVEDGDDVVRMTLRDIIDNNITEIFTKIDGFTA